jgi:hypothetical protein
LQNVYGARVIVILKILAVLPFSGVTETDTSLGPTANWISPLSTPDAVTVLLTLITATELWVETRTLTIDTELATDCVYNNNELLKG